MHRMLRNLWQDDAGALIASEFLFVATILVIGVVVGLTNVREAINVELSELGNAILALSQGYTISGSSGGAASVDGSAAIDTPALLPESTLTPPFAPSLIDQQPCN
jgi:Flp pilus assembly pilin Flp